MIKLRIRDKEDLEFLSEEDCEWLVINHEGKVEEFGDSSGRVKDWLEVAVFVDGKELGVL